MSARILVIGKLPPPIGGVTIHVQRLLEHLKLNKIDFSFYNLNEFSCFTLIHSIINNDIIHLHCSSPYLRFFFILLCKVLGRTSVMTVHGNFGRFSGVKKLCDKYAVKYATCPIMINKNSYKKAIQLNSRTQFISAYLPMTNVPATAGDILEKIEGLKRYTDCICCTNAYNYTLDKDGTEIYGISSLVDFFNKRPRWGLIISDPSGVYAKRLAGQFKEGGNIVVINKPHIFLHVLQHSNCFIRYTSTDGDSLSIHEAKDLNVPVIATDVVDRPGYVRLVSRDNFEELEAAVSELVTTSFTGYFINHEETNIIKLYKDMLVQS